MQYLQTRRLLLAKQLLTDSRLPVAQVALASGFRSLRRFNAAFADSYRMSPRRLRGEADGDAAGGRPRRCDEALEAITVTLGFRPPYDLTALLRFFALRAIPGIEHVDGSTIRRTLRAGSVATDAGWIEASFSPAACRVQLRFAASLASASSRIVGSARRWLDLDAVPHAIDAALAGLPGTPGIRLPGSLDAFELAVRAVLGQQVTVAAARTLARRLVERFGAPIATPWPEVARLFPAPERLAAATLEQVAELGIVRTRAATLLALARAWPHLNSTLEASGSPHALVESLDALPGIGPWTAHYIAMRAFGWPDAFPPQDVAVLKAMRELFDTPNQRRADAHAEAWRPWRAYAVLRLWNSLEKKTP
jgi:AraC family transcriptional regulator of adaptative response / DNA-3-methyladenine glycosylase II